MLHPAGMFRSKSCLHAAVARTLHPPAAAFSALQPWRLHQSKDTLPSFVAQHPRDPHLCFSSSCKRRVRAVWIFEQHQTHAEERQWRRGKGELESAPAVGALSSRHWIGVRSTYGMVLVASESRESGSNCRALQHSSFQILPSRTELGTEIHRPTRATPGEATSPRVSSLVPLPSADTLPLSFEFQISRVDSNGSVNILVLTFRST